MYRLVTIDLSDADLSLFQAYETKALAQLPKYGARLEWRVRTVDGQTEIHLIYYPDADALNAFLADPERQAARVQWDHSGAHVSAVEVTHIS